MYNAEDPKIFLGFNRRFSKASMFIKEKLNASPANALNFRFSVPKLERDHWTNIKEIGGGRVVGEAIHAIDLGTYFFDSLPQSISSYSPIDKELDEAQDNQVFININWINCMMYTMLRRCDKNVFKYAKFSNMSCVVPKLSKKMKGQ